MKPRNKLSVEKIIDSKNISPEKCSPGPYRYVYYLEHRNLLQAKSLNLEKIMNEKMSKRKIQITDLQKQEIEEKQEIRLLIRLHIFYLILLINL